MEKKKTVQYLTEETTETDDAQYGVRPVVIKLSPYEADNISHLIKEIKNKLVEIDHTIYKSPYPDDECPF